MAVFTWIEGWYKTRRPDSGLGDLSPMNFERRQLSSFNAREHDRLHADEAPQIV